jgi:hypothetical protein
VGPEKAHCRLTGVLGDEDHEGHEHDDRDHDGRPGRTEPGRSSRGGIDGPVDRSTGRWVTPWPIGPAPPDVIDGCLACLHGSPFGHTSPATEVELPVSVPVETVGSDARSRPTTSRWEQCPAPVRFALPRRRVRDVVEPRSGAVTAPTLPVRLLGAGTRSADGRRSVAAVGPRVKVGVTRDRERDRVSGRMRHVALSVPSGFSRQLRHGPSRTTPMWVGGCLCALPCRHRPGPGVPADCYARRHQVDSHCHLATCRPVG